MTVVIGDVIHAYLFDEAGSPPAEVLDHIGAVDFTVTQDVLSVDLWVQETTTTLSNDTALLSDFSEVNPTDNNKIFTTGTDAPDIGAAGITFTATFYGGPDDTGSAQKTLIYINDVPNSAEIRLAYRFLSGTIFWIIDDGTTFHQIFGQAYTVGGWNTLIGTINPTATTSFYLNGTETTAATAVDEWTWGASTTYNMITTSTGAQGGVCDLILDNLYILDRGIDDTEAAQIYNSGDPLVVDLTTLGLLAASETPSSTAPDPTRDFTAYGTTIADNKPKQRKTPRPPMRGLF